VQLAASQSGALEIAGPATSYELSLRYPDASAEQLASVALTLTWDDAAQPAISLPLLELFAATPTAPELPNMWLKNVRDGADRVASLTLPLPFASKARLGFENQSSSDVSFVLAAYGEHAPPPLAAGRLHVERRQTDGPTQQATHVALETQGRGRLVGTCGYWQGHQDPNASVLISPLNLLEGDVNAWVDGEIALHGTGTEEYTDDVFYFKEAPHARPFEQAWGISDARDPGKASFCRWHVLGTQLDYRSTFKLEFELGGAGNVSLVERVRTVAYYYQKD
jgi:hypothetical protein